MAKPKRNICVTTKVSATELGMLTTVAAASNCSLAAVVRAQALAGARKRLRELVEAPDVEPTIPPSA